MAKVADMIGGDRARTGCVECLCWRGVGKAVVMEELGDENEKKRMKRKPWSSDGAEREIRGRQPCKHRR